MKLKPQLIKKFVKATSDNVQPKKESIVYGTIVSYDGDTKTAHVKLDGATTTIPVTHHTSTVNTDERVIVMIKNHTAIITGNVVSPAAGVKYVDDKTYIRKNTTIHTGTGQFENRGDITFEDDGFNVYPVFKFVDNSNGSVTTTKKILLEGDAGGGGTVDITTVDLDKVRALWPDCNYEN